MLCLGAGRVIGLGLLDECASALVDVAGANAEHLVTILHRDRRLERGRIDTPREALLGEAECQRRGLDHIARELSRCRVDLGIRHSDLSFRHCEGFSLVRKQI